MYREETEGREVFTNVQRLMNIICNRRDNKCRHPVGMPDSAQDGAKWFIKLLEPRMQFEIDEQNNNHYPYQDRLADCLRQFYKLSRSDQQLIITWSGQGIMWRGDSMDFMKVRSKVKPEMMDKDKLMKTMYSMVGGKK